MLAFACTRDNPAFDDCETDASCVDESGSPGDGDGDPGDGDPGDGDPGDGDPGDGDPGDGDGDAGDGDGDGDAGDGDAGDGDGDGEGPALPTCPDALWVSIPLAQDTFLDGTPAANGNSCTVDWDFEIDQPVFGDALCPGLDFGGSTGHWVCAGVGCISAWLGQFELVDWMEFPVQVQEAGFEFTAKYQNFEVNSVIAHELLVDGVEFGDCGEWHAGEGMGEPPSDCATTFAHSAFPNVWQVNNQLFQGGVIAAAAIPPSGDAYVEHSFFMPIDPARVQGWLDGQVVHHGVVLSSDAWLPTQLYLYAQGSGADPHLKARLCLP